MRIEIDISTDGAAFEDNCLTESARLVHEVATRIGQGEQVGRLRDGNGNSIGTWILTGSDC